MKKFGKRLLAVLLTLALLLGLLPGMALAAEPGKVALDDAAGAYRVTVCTTATGLSIRDSAGNPVTVQTGKVEDYNSYTFTANAGTYTYQADGYGTGVLKVSGDTTVYLREIQYTLQKAGECNFKMRVVSTLDAALVYQSEASVDAKVAKLLVPAYGYNVRYQYFFEPVDEKYCPFYGNLWVLPGTTAFEGFKTTSYNLSDGRVYLMCKKTTVNFKIPAGATLRVEELVKFYRQNNQFYTEKTKTEDGYDYYTATVPLSPSGEVYYVVSKAGFRKTAHTFTPAGQTIAVDALQEDYQLHEDTYEANIITNGNAAKFVSLQQGEAFDLWSSRAWQAINNGLSNGYLEPDKHYYVVDGDSVTVDEYGIVRAVKNGISVVAVTYDAMDWDDHTYGAIREDCVGVFAFQVGGSSAGVKTGLEGLSDLHTFYIAKSVTVDGAEGKTENAYTTYTINPTAPEGQTLHVSVMTVSGYPQPTTSGWKDCAANADGSYTLQLYPGRNVVKVQAGDAVRCFVLHAVASSVVIENVTNPGSAIKAGDTAKVSYSNVVTPQPKLGAIYNPGYGGTVYLEGKLLDEDGAEVGTAKGEGTQYDIAKNAYLNVTPSAAGQFTVSGVRIHLGAFGAAPTTHLTLSLQSEGGSYTGDDSPEATGYWSWFQDVQFTAAVSDFPAAAAAIVAMINDIGDVTYTEACKAKIDKARHAYDSAVEQVKSIITPEQYKVLTDAEAAYEKLEYTAIGEKMQKRTIEGKEFYVITNADELLWFAKTVNGLVNGTAERQEDINAVLENDIVFNLAVLNEKNELLSAQGLRAWTPIGGYSWKEGTGYFAKTKTAEYRGIFDGQGHTIRGLYMENAWGNTTLHGYTGLFGATNGATIKNIQVVDSYYNNPSDSYTGGLIGRMDNTTAESLSFEGYVCGEYSTGGIVGGVQGDGLTTVIRNCRVKATIAGQSGIGGVVGSGGSATILDCSVQGAVSGSGNVGGVAGTNVKQLERCAVEADVSATDGSVGGITSSLSSKGSITSCYVVGNLTADTSNRKAAGIVTAAKGGTIKNCYYMGTITGAVTYACADDTAVLDDTFYCLNNCGEENANIAVMTQEQFESGYVAAMLGRAYGQKLGQEKHPVLNDGTNQVFLVNGTPQYGSAAVCQQLIDSIGTVALDGTANCFRAVTAAQACYEMLSAEEQAKVTNYALLQEKLAAYDAVAAAYIAELDALGEITLESKAAIETARAHYNAYIERGGEKARITNLALLASAEADYALCVTAENERKIEASMGTRTVDGKEFYEISNAEQLTWFRMLVNGELAKKPQNTAANAVLVADITLNENLLSTIFDDAGTLLPDKLSKMERWKPIGRPYEIIYSGTFDGDGHVLSGLYTEAADGNDYTGMFGHVTGTIQNLTLRDTYSAGAEAAPLAYLVEKTGVIDHCVAEGNAIARSYAGGLVNSLINRAHMRNCYVMGTVSSKTRAGGLVVSSGGTMENCYVNAQVLNAKKKGGIAVLVNSAAVFRNCFFPEAEGVNIYNLGGNQQADVVENSAPYTPEQLANGYVAGQLGTAFAQRVGVDPYPVFAEALPTAEITVELERDNYAKHAEVIARVYLTGTQTAGTIGYSLTYNAAELELQTAQAAANLTADDRSAAGSILRTLTLADGAKLEAGEDGRILLDTLTFTAKKACTASFGLDGIAGDETFGDSPAFVHDTGVSLATTLRQTYVTTEEADREAAAAVDALIDAIGKVTTDSGDAIAAARAAYDALTPQQKDYVEHYETLTFAEETYQRLPDCTSGKHVYPEWKVTKEATCDETGEMSGICKYCGHVGTLTVAALGHDWDAGKQTKAPTCTEAGTMHFTCQRAGCKGEKDETIAKLAHEYEATVTAPTCESAGYTTHTCKTCGDSYIDTMVPAKGHTDKAVVTAPTCDTMGYTTHTCATCGRSYVDSYTAATDHDYKSEVTKEATCTAEGVLTFTCQHEGCGKTYTQAIPKADHAMTATVTKPTCLSFGYTEYRCQHCDYSYVNAFTQPTGHAWNDGEVTVQPTIWETGTMTYTCENCGETRTEEIAKLPACEGGVYCPSRQFADVDQMLWYHDAVDYVFTHGLMYGTTDTTFSPDDALTRAMFVTMLYRMEGKPEVKDAASFTDVPEGAYYADAVAWASANGVVYGTSETAFSPDEKITREQMAAMMRRYADYRKLTSSTWVDLGSYADASSISSWATESMQWAVASELMYGNTRNQLQPAANATRAQAAAILQRFVTKIVK